MTTGLYSGGLRDLGCEGATQGVLWFSLLLLPFLAVFQKPNKFSSCKTDRVSLVAISFRVFVLGGTLMKTLECRRGFDSLTLS